MARLSKSKSGTSISGISSSKKLATVEKKASTKDKVSRVAPKMPPKTPPKEWWAEGVRFECQGSGKCCVSRGQYGFVYLTPEDRRRMAKVMKLSTREFTRLHCTKTDGIWHLREIKSKDCVFLENGNRCGVYEGRPSQCRTWPFWPEVMNAKTWKKEVAAFCPGIGKGRLHTAEEIKAVLKSQESWQDDLAKTR